MNNSFDYSFDRLNLVIKLGRKPYSLYRISLDMHVEKLVSLELAQFEGGGPRSRPPSELARGTTAFIRLAHGVVGIIWLDLGALNQG